MINILTKKEFVAKANTANEINTINEKYLTIFAKYNCFNDVVAQSFVPQSSSSQHFKPFYGSGSKKQYVGKFHTSHASHPCNIRKPLSKDIIHSIIGFLNVINTDNYNKIFSKIRIGLERNNVEFVTKTILEKCCTATIFVNVYIKLMDDINNIYTNKHIIQDHVISFRSRVKFEQSNNHCDAYDLFCKKQKHKLFVIGMNTTVIKLCKAGLIDWDILKSHYDHFQEIVLTADNEYDLDLGINIIIDLAKAYKILLPNPQELAAMIQTEIPRLRFLVQTLSEVHS